MIDKTVAVAVTEAHNKQRRKNPLNLYIFHMNKPDDGHNAKIAKI